MENSTKRKNVGFTIVASVGFNSNEEIVLGFNPLTGQYVTWLCLNGSDYNWGHYTDNLAIAFEDLLRRSETLGEGHYEIKTRVLEQIIALMPIARKEVVA